MVKLLGRVAIPPQAVPDVAKLDVRPEEMPDGDVAFDISVFAVSEFFKLESARANALSEELARLLIDTKQMFAGGPDNEELSCHIGRTAGSLVGFRNVVGHTDPYLQLRAKSEKGEIGSLIPAATFGIVLVGGCTLQMHFGDAIQPLRLEPGDVYVFDHCVTHSVTNASELCLHLSGSIPMSTADQMRPGVFSAPNTDKTAGRGAPEETLPRAA